MSTLVGVQRGLWYEHPNQTNISAPSTFLIEGGPQNVAGLLTVGFKLSCAEKTGTVQCFGGVNHIYAFGHDPERSSYTLTLLLFPGSCGKTMPIKNVMSLYDKRKASVQKTVTVTMAGTTYKGLVQGIEISVYDGELNILQATIMGQILLKV